MYIIDRYLLRQFVQTFMICFLSLTGIYVVFDAFTNLDQFQRCGDMAGGVFSFMVHYYSYQWIKIFDMLSGMFALVSAMFTVAWIQRNNEMTALMAAGVSRIRVLVPIIVAVGVVSVLSTMNRELLMPRHRGELSRGPKNPLGDKPENFKARYDEKTSVLLTGKCAFAYWKRIDQPDFKLMLAPAELRKHGDQLVADSATYLAAQGNRPGGYLLTGVRQPKHIDTCSSLFLNNEAVLVTPRDAPDWLKPDQCFLKSNVDFEQLTEADAVRQLSSTAQLISDLHNPSLGSNLDVRVAIHARIVKPLLDMTLLFLGLPLVVNRESRNVFLAMGMCVLVTTGFTLAVIVLQKFGESSFLLSPAQAAWAPLMIFVPLAVWLGEWLWK